MKKNHRDLMLAAGGVIDRALDVPLHFGHPDYELRAALQRCVVADRSDLSRSIGDGPDLLDLLHRLGTGDVNGLTPGEGRPTVLTTGKGRIVERLFVHHLGEPGVLLIGGRGRTATIEAHLSRYTFAEKTGLADAAPATALFVVSGPETPAALAAMGLPQPAPHGNVTHVYEGSPVHLLGHDGHGTTGVSLLVGRDRAAGVWQGLSLAVSSVDGRAAGVEALEAARVLRGFPAAGHELTEAANPLEVGLWDAVSFDKGCYVGQEVIARLRTYDKVARTLRGLRWEGRATLPAPGSPVTLEGSRIGWVTSALVPPGWDHPVGLALVKQRQAGPGSTVELANGLRAELVELPFVP